MATLPSFSSGAETVIVQNEELSVTISKTGAELQSIRHIPTDIEYLWQGDPEYWSARSPNMFPVNVRFKDQAFAYQGKVYEMPFLGVAVKAPFEAMNEPGDAPHGTKTTLVLHSSDETLQYYPFPFRLEITSEVHGLTLQQRYTVANTGSETLFFALGGHPGFRAPFIHGRDRSDYQIRFSQSMQVNRDEIREGLRTQNRIKFLNNEDRLTLDDPRIPNSGMFLEDHDSRQIGVALKDRAPYVTVDLGDFPNTNLWTPPGMPYVCIEPMVAHHDLEESPRAIEEKKYLTPLPAGESRTYEFSITINPAEGMRALRE